MVVVVVWWCGGERFRCVVPLHPAVRLASVPFCSQRSLLSSQRSDTQSLVFSSSRSNRPASPSVRLHLHFKWNTCHFFSFFGSPLLTSLHPSFHQCNPRVIITRCLKFCSQGFLAGQRLWSPRVREDDEGFGIFCKNVQPLAASLDLSDGGAWLSLQMTTICAYQSNNVIKFLSFLSECLPACRVASKYRPWMLV